MRTKQLDLKWVVVTVQPWTRSWTVELAVCLAGRWSFLSLSSWWKWQDRRWHLAGYLIWRERVVRIWQLWPFPHHPKGARPHAQALDHHAHRDIRNER